MAVNDGSASNLIGGEMQAVRPAMPAANDPTGVVGAYNNPELDPTGASFSPMDTVEPPQFNFEANPMGAPQDMQGEIAPPQFDFQDPTQAAQAGVPAQPFDGSVNLPVPAQDKSGFWETLRMSARKDPYTFYSILSNMATLNPGGIRNAMAERQQRLTAEQERRDRFRVLKSKQDTAALSLKRKQYQRDEDYVRDTRKNAANKGHLDAFEKELGREVSTVEDADQLQTFIGEQEGAETNQKVMTNLAKQLYRTPELNWRKTPKGKRLAKDNPELAESLDNIARSSKDRRQLHQEKMRATLTMTQERITGLRQVIRERAGALTDVEKSRLSNLERRIGTMQREFLDAQEAFELDEAMAQWVGVEQLPTYQAKKDRRDQARKEWEAAMEEADLYIGSRDPSAYKVVDPADVPQWLKEKYGFSDDDMRGDAENPAIQDAAKEREAEEDEEMDAWAEAALNEIDTMLSGRAEAKADKQKSK